MTNAELIALLREAREVALGVMRAANSISYVQWSPEMHRASMVLRDIDAALAEHEVEERVDSATPVVEWWSQSQQEASMGQAFLRVWCAGPHAWRWTAWGHEILHKSGTTTTETDAKAAAIAAAKGMK